MELTGTASPVRFVSTRGRAPPASLDEAVLRGLAPDGGLYMPVPLRPLSRETLASFRDTDFPGVAQSACRHLLGDELSSSTVDEIVGSAFDFPVPLVELGDGSYVLELFHGPTLAFKDVGARFMARLVAALDRDPDPLTVLVATSGDTGSAVASAFLGVEGTRTVVLFPEGRVSELQERQFTTLGGNVHALAVAGSFDDCQQMVKEAFGDRGLRDRLRLTSANSINVGRLLPQAFYYLYAWSRLDPGDGAPVFSTPSGNFGNLAAGLIAHRLGMPATRFVAATNVNDVVPAYLASGRYEPRESVSTISSAMDVGAPSNLARIEALYDGSIDAVRSDVLGSAHADDETRERIRIVHDRYAYVLDPHTAVGHLGLDDGRRAHPSAPPVVLATAHPAKFREVVEPVIDQKIELPTRLAACLERERRVERIEARAGALEAWLLSLP